ncbi:MAG: hypothetical protein OXD54_15330 [Candidatus Poribacteria bacterium]|nr:hypothetical protein [Candidatus Poribacteria bacterium]
MKHTGVICICSILIMFLLSCQEERGNFTLVNQENVYIFGVWKAPTTKSANEALSAISANVQDKVTAQIKENGKEEVVYKMLPTLTTAAPETLLPQDGEITDWVRAQKPTTYTPETLYKDRILLSEDDRDIYYNYGFKRKTEVEYQSSKFESIPYILLEIFDMGTPENAFGIFSVYSYPQPKFEWVGCKAIISGKYLWFWKGKYFIQIEGYAIATGIRKAMVALAEATAKRILDPPQKIPFLEILPNQYIRGSEKYFKTNWALRQVNKSLPNPFPQLTDDTVGISAQYNIRSNNPTHPYNIFVIRFPDVSTAQSAYSMYRDTLKGENLHFVTDTENGAIQINEQYSEP